MYEQLLFQAVTTSSPQIKSRTAESSEQLMRTGLKPRTSLSQGNYFACYDNPAPPASGTMDYVALKALLGILT